MKSIAFLFSTLTIMALSSCSSSTETTTITEPAAEASAPAKPSSSDKPAEKTDQKSTELNVSDDGITVKSKDGDKETNVELTEDKKSVIIKQ